MTRIVRLIPFAAVLVVASCNCAPPATDTPPLRPAAVGTIVGEAFIEDPDQSPDPISISGAVVEVYGKSAQVETEAGKQFVLQSIPLGEHTLLITHPASGRSIRFAAALESPYQTLTLPGATTTLKTAAQLTGQVHVPDASPAGTLVYLVGGNRRQVTQCGDDGSFDLPLLPPGPAQIAFSRVGYDTAIVDIDLGEGDNALDNDVTLAAAAGGALTMTSRVILDGLIDHRGTAVLLNGGEQVASTDERGAFSFANLSPGLYSIRAQRPGFRSVELPQVALTSDGDAYGIVEMFMAPGVDPLQETVPTGVVPRPSTSLGSTGSGLVQVPPLEEGVDEVGNPLARITIEQGQPVALGVEAAIGDAVWVGDTGASFVGVAELGTLTEGLHTFDLSYVVDGGGSVSATVIVTVEPLRFTIAVGHPASDETSFAGDGLPYAVAVTHGFQRAFPATSVTWRDTDGNVVGTGTQGTINGLAVGFGTLQLDVTDVVGNHRSAVVPYQVEDLTFLANFDFPYQNFTMNVGDEVSAVLSLTQTPEILPIADITVELRSSIQGLVAGPVPLEGNSLSLSALTAGTHQLTATISGSNADGETRTVFARTTVIVNGPVLAAELLAPTGAVVVSDGVGDLNFRVAPTWTGNGTASVSWYLNGTVLPQSLEASSDNDVNTLLLGTFDSRVAPFNAAPWSTRTGHVLTVAVAKPGINVNVGPSGTCTVQAPGSAGDVVCLQRRIDIAQPARFIDATTLSSGTDTWGPGTVELRGRYDITAGATLIVQPGTTVIVNNSSCSDYYGSGIHVTQGSLLIGSADANAAQVEIRGRNPACQWYGVYIESSQPTQPADIRIAHAVIRDAVYALYDGGVDSDLRTVSLLDVEFSDSGYGYGNARCPTRFEDVRFARIANTALDLRDSPGCGDGVRTFRGFSVDGASTGVQVRDPGPFVFEGVSMSYLRNAGIASSVAGSDLTIIDSTFVGGTENYYSGGITVDGDNVTVNIENNTFVDNQLAVQIYVNDPPSRVSVLGNHFVDNATAIRTVAPATAETIEVHFNTFEGAGTYIDMTSSYGADVGVDLRAEANFIGSTPGTPGHLLASRPPGVPLNLPRITDSYDTTDERIPVVRADHALSVPREQMSIPTQLVLVEPRETIPYRTDHCLPLLVKTPLGAPPGTCGWQIDGTSIQDSDADGCADTVPTLQDGEHAITYQCDIDDDNNPATPRTVTDTASGRVLIDNTRWSGDLTSPQVTWSGEVLIDGDVIISAGTTLTITAGTQVRFAAGDRTRFSLPSSNYYGVRAGTPQLTDLHVFGTLNVQGTAGAPVVFEAENGLNIANQYGGIVVQPGGVVDVDHAEFVGATRALRGVRYNNDPLNAPVLAVRDTNFHDLSTIISEVCPTVFLRNTGTNVSEILEDAGCFTDFAMVDSSFQNVGTNSSYLVNLLSYDAAALPSPLAVRIENSVINGIAGSRSGEVLRVYGSSPASVSSVQILGSDLGHAGTLMNTNHPVHIEDATLHDFSDLRSADSPLFEVVHSTIENGSRVINYGYYSGFYSFLSTRFLHMDTVFNYQLEQNLSARLEVVGCEFDDVDVAFHFNYYYYATQSPQQLDLSGNNFLNTRTAVVQLEYDVNGNQPATLFDVTGSHFGTTDTAAIEALLQDTRPDASANDTVVGNTDYAGFTATPLSLGLLP